MNAADPYVSVILPAYHSDATLAACLDGLRRQTYRNFETIVVNSSPETRTRSIVAERYPEVVFEQSAMRLLPHAARNRGVRLARGRLLVFSDPDCIPRPDWLAALVAACGAGHEAVGGSMDLAGGGWFACGVHLCKFHGLLPGLPPGPRWILPTANACYTRKAWDAAGPFDDALMIADALLSWRSQQAGCTTWFEPAARVGHYHDDTPGSFWRARRRRGLEFAEARMAHEAWSRRRTAVFVLAMPMLVGLVVLRAGRDALRSGWALRYLVTLPVQILGHVAWSAGEWHAHWRHLRRPSRDPEKQRCASA